jgi:hypothetical protein
MKLTNRAKSALATAGYSVDGSRIGNKFFRSEKEAQDKLRDLTERGVISGIPVKIVPWVPEPAKVRGL